MLALAMVAAEPIGPADWITPYDYPAAALKEGRGGYTEFVLRVSAAGMPLSCGIIESSGFDDLDWKTCEALLQRGRFEPARDAAGRAVPALYRNRNRWWAGAGLMPKARPVIPDMILTVAQLPKGMKAPLDLTVVFAVDVNGRISDCDGTIPGSRPRPGSKKEGEGQRQIRLLAPAACKALTEGLDPPIFRDQDGQAAMSIQTGRVRFEIK